MAAVGRYFCLPVEVRIDRKAIQIRQANKNKGKNRVR